MMKTFEKFVNTKTIKDFPYVIEFFKKFYPEKNISNIPVYIVSEKEWPARKSRGTESDGNGGIRIHESRVNNEQDIGWLIHEVGHVLELKGDKKPYLVSKKEFKVYPNEDNEQVPMWYQFHYLINKGLSEDDLIELESREYSNCKGGGTLWSDYKDNFFRRYFKEIKKILIH